MNKKTVRINKLIDILKVRSFVSIKELSSVLNVSEMTIRRDLEILKDNNIAENIYGTTVYNPAHTVAKNEDEYNLLGETKKKNTQKDDIGRFAASLVNEDDIIIIDSGSTTERIAASLPVDRNISVLCYNINILMELRRNPGVKMIFAGGFYHSNTQMFECPESIDFIKGVRAQKVFVSAAGVHSQLGVTCANSYEVPVKRAILQSSLQKILVTDSSKFDIVRPAFFCELDQIDVIVTDNNLSEDWRSRISEAGITLYTV
ncbi:MAG: DeoR/GlpR family DNA-binding transcription regulator [Oscillospiraceae bacterium]